MSAGLRQYEEEEFRRRFRGELPPEEVKRRLEEGRRAGARAVGSCSASPQFGLLSMSKTFRPLRSAAPLSNAS